MRDILHPGRRLASVLLATVILAAAGPSAPDPIGSVEFARDDLSLYPDQNGKPGKPASRIAAADVNRAASSFTDYSLKYRMFRVELATSGGVRKGWLSRSDFQPLPHSDPRCTSTTAVASLTPAPSSTTAGRTIAAGQGLAEQLCQ